MGVLPTGPSLMRIVQSLAALDLILEPDWESRTYSYNAKWGPGEELASMRDGSGDDWFMVLHVSGWVAVKGFAHESEAAGEAGWAEALQQAVPGELAAFANEPAYKWEDSTFCYWRLADDPGWSSGREMAGLDASIETGEAGLLEILGSGPAGYKAYADAYFEIDVPLHAVEAIYEHRPLTDGLVRKLNPGVGLADIAEGLEEIGYPNQAS